MHEKNYNNSNMSMAKCKVHTNKESINMSTTPLDYSFLFLAF